MFSFQICNSSHQEKEKRKKVLNFIFIYASLFLAFLITNYFLWFTCLLSTTFLSCCFFLTWGFCFLSISCHGLVTHFFPIYLFLPFLVPCMEMEEGLGEFATDYVICQHKILAYIMAFPRKIHFIITLKRDELFLFFVFWTDERGEFSDSHSSV